MGRIHDLGDKLIKSDSIVFTYIRSIVSSQSASWVDMGLSFVLFAWVGLLPWLATAIGAVVGGAVNCIINYRFTFRASGCDWRAVVVKYSLVWLGSLALNALGTQLLYALISGWTWLETIGFRPDGYFAAARLFVSLIVSWFWNFALQRYFVYRPTGFDSKAVAFARFLGFKDRNKINEQ